MMTKLICGAAALVLLAATAANAQEGPARVGITVGTLGNPFFVPLVAGAEDAIRAANPDASITVVGAEYDLNTQSSQIDSFIAAGVELIIINAVDAVAIGPAVRRAKAAGIVVGAMDVTAEGADVTVMTNNFQAGQIACEHLAEQLGGQGEVVIINGPPISSIIDRVEGCKDAFSNHDGITVLSDNQDGRASRDGGFEVMQGLLTRFSHIDAVFGANDPTAIGADLAARQLNRDEMIIAGVDGSPDLVAALRQEGTRIVASSSQDPYGMAARAAELAIGILNGQAPENDVELLDTELVTQDNVADYQGWDAAR